MLLDMEHATHRSAPSDGPRNTGSDQWSEQTKAGGSVMPLSQSLQGAHEASVATSSASDSLLLLMRYKRWADAELLDAVLALPMLPSAPEGSIVTAIIRHFHTVDCIFKAHLLGVPHEYSSTNPAEPAALAELRERVHVVDDWYVEYAQHLDEHALGQALRVEFTDGQEQVLTRSEILHYISLHGGGHRGQVSLLLRKIGAVPPPDRLTNYLREHPPA
jgi:uncharacterized damage-inducible protein DinB